MLAHYCADYGPRCGLISAVAVSATSNYVEIVRRMQSGLIGRLFERLLVEIVKMHFKPHVHRFESVPGVSVKGALAARSIAEWHEAVTCPLRGIRSSAEFCQSVSFSHLLPRTAIPMLMINSENDPICPADAVPADSGAENVIVARTRGGGHTAFLEGLWPFGQRGALEAAWDTRVALQFSAAALALSRGQQQSLQQPPLKQAAPLSHLAAPGSSSVAGGRMAASSVSAGS